MKTVFSLFAIGMLAVCMSAQEPKVVAEITASNDHSNMKGAPFSADAVNESIQTLADGNRIVHTSQSKFYRNGEGRVRREMTRSSGGLFNTFLGGMGGEGVSIMGGSGFSYMIDNQMRTARQLSTLPLKELTIARATAPLSDEQKAAIERLKTQLKDSDGKLTDEQRAELERLHIRVGEVDKSIIVTGDGASTVVGVGSGSGTAFSGVFTGSMPKYETRTEDLGSRNIEGVDCEGTRRTTTIPANAIGNERPIETTYERWYSKELGVVVYSKNTDPRFGEQTYHLINIVRAEPDPSLFTLPKGYNLITGPDDTYRVTTTVKTEGDKPMRKLKTDQE